MNLKAFFKKPLFLIILSGVFTLLICLGLVFLIILPSLTDKSGLEKTLASVQGSIGSINTNIVSIKTLDKDKINSFDKTLSVFYPETGDHLHFATVNDVLAKSLGVLVTSISVTSAKIVSSATAPSVGPAAGSSSAGSSSATSAASVGKNDVFLLVSYAGDFASIESLLSKVQNLDRAVGVSKVVLSGTDDSLAQISATVTYDLPLAQKAPAPTNGNVSLLSSADEKLLTDIAKKIEFFGNPSSDPLGKTNPFQ